MDQTVLLASIGISLILTVFGYLLVPTMLALSGKKYEAKKLKRINIVNCIAVWFLFRVVQAALGGEVSSGAAVVLWGAVGHWILKKHCLKERDSLCAVSSISDTEENRDCEYLSDEGDCADSYGNRNVGNVGTVQNKDEERLNTIPIEITIPLKEQSTRIPVNKRKGKFCSYCGKPIDPATKKCQGCGKQYFKGISWKAVLTTLLVIIFAISFVGNILLCLKNIELNEELLETQSVAERVSSLEKSNSDYRKEIVELKADIADLKTEKNKYKKQVSDYAVKISFYDNYVVFIENDGTKYYHKYDCSKFAGKSFWAYNTEAAKERGYYPCPTCHD